MKKLKQRNELDKKYMWDIEDMYSSSSQWEKDLAESETLAKEYASYRGRLTESSGTLLAAFKLKDELWLKLERVYVYAHMKKDEDNRVEASQSMNDKAGAMIAKVSALTSFSTPELLSSDEKTLLGYIDEEPGLEMYRFAIEDLLREKDHVLSHDEENILAQMGEVLPATNEIFTMLNNAEMDFGTVKNEDGEDVQLTHGNYITFMQSHDRNVRKSAYEAMYSAFKKLINTIATAYSYNTKTDVVTARIRKYDSARAAALSGDNIPADVYDNLVDTVNRNLPVLHRYIDIRKKLLGVDELKMHDVYVPLIEMPKRRYLMNRLLKSSRKALRLWEMNTWPG